LDFIELEVDVAFGVGVDRNVDDVPVAVLGFLSNIIF